tara:strand:- start:444 stop:656 length:213 start_codon:yes stop_codon:yes gene_type:complete
MKAILIEPDKDSITQFDPYYHVEKEYFELIQRQRDEENKLLTKIRLVIGEYNSWLTKIQVIREIDTKLND